MRYLFGILAVFALFAPAAVAEAAIRFSSSEYAVSEGEAATIVLRSDAPVERRTIVNVLITSGRGITPSDVVNPIFKVVVFGEGDSEKSFVIRSREDGLTENTESLTLKILGTDERATLSIVDRPKSGVIPTPGSSPAAGTWATRAPTGFDLLTPSCNPVPVTGTACSTPGEVCKSSGIVYYCRGRMESIEVRGKVSDYNTGVPVSGAKVIAHAVYGGGFEVETVTDASGSYVFQNFIPQLYHVIRAEKSGYSYVYTGVSVASGRDLAPNAPSAVIELADLKLVRHDENYVGPFENIQEGPGETISFSGGRKVLYGTAATLVWKGLGSRGELCQVTITDPLNAANNNTDPQYCNKRQNYRALDSLGYSYNSARDEWSGRIDHSIYPIDFRYFIAGFNPDNRKAASLVVSVTPFAADADNQTYTPIFPQWGWGTSAGWNFYIMPVETKRIGQPITISVTGGQAGSSVSISAEQSSRPGDSVDIVSPEGIVNSQGHYSTMVIVRGLPRTVSFRADSPARPRSIGGYANFHYGTGQVTPPPPGSGPAPSLSLTVKHNGAAATSPLTVRVGDSLRYEWNDAGPVGATYRSTWTRVSGDAARCGSTGQWEVTQANGRNGSQDRIVWAEQAGCGYRVEYEATGNGQTVKKDFTITIAADTCPAVTAGTGTFANSSGGQTEYWCGLLVNRPNDRLAPYNWVDQSPSCTDTSKMKCWHRFVQPAPASAPLGGTDSETGTNGNGNALQNWLTTILNLIF